MSAPLFARVAIPLAVEGTFTYAIPDELRSACSRGMRVEVPFGTKRMTGFVLEIVDRSDTEPSKTKNVLSVFDDEPALLGSIIDLCTWAADYYLAPIGEMLKIALPSTMTKAGRRVARAVASDDEADASLERGAITSEEFALFTAIARGEIAAREIAENRAAIRKLERVGLVVVTDELKDREGVRFDRFATLLSIPANPTSQQRRIIDMLSTEGETSISRLVEMGASESALRTLQKNGAIGVIRRARHHRIDSFLTEHSAAPVGELHYSDEQRNAFERIRAALGTYRAFLLQGITGSGKTEVYIEAMREAVRMGGQAILLVPEISLTPVFAARLRERFGDRIAILHSSLSPSERHDQWWRARRGVVDVAIGPRSALFTPFEKLGLLIVDEEGDGAYKQEETPRYNARDLAVVHAQFLGIPVVLGSATPSLESRENAARGKYELLRLTRRVESRPLPEVTIVDIRKERGEKEDRGLVIFGDILKDELHRTFEAGQQAIVLMNRRGYAPYLLCRECENDFRCRDCSVTMTVHRRTGFLICHYCGHRIAIPRACPLCTGEVLEPIGFGTEKVEERFRKLFPAVPVAVVDRDTTRKRGALVSILDRFRSGGLQALIGTQMISKGHHFPNVTMTAVINADAILGYPDFRSAEKTFYLLTQVAGRSGRGDLPGRVLVQSAFPTHYAVQHASRHDYEAFFDAEIQFRKRFGYPPATGMIAILFRGEEVAEVEKVAVATSRRLEKAIAGVGDVRMQGPAPAPLAKIKGVFRYQILLRSARRPALRRAVAEAIPTRDHRSVDIVIDVDPINIL
jgi:primosomal protein N' (replication factor Y) (superfamily II helicase)